MRYNRLVKADNIPKLPKMTPTRYNKIIDSLFEEGYNLADLCRYDAPVATIFQDFRKY